MKLFNRRLIRFALFLLILAGLFLIGGIGVIQIKRHQTVILPAPTGTYSVGRTAHDWIDPARPDPFAENQQRELLVMVWYPAEKNNDLPPAYLPDQWRQAREHWMGIGSYLEQDLSKIQTHSTLDTPLNAAEAPYPVLIFMPGMGRIVPDYTTLIENVTSHGYIVFGITPTYSASVVAFLDGRIAERKRAADMPDNPSLDAFQQKGRELVDIWAADAIFTLNQIENLNSDPQSRFYGQLDLNQIGFFGHSFGGATAAEVCSLDQRCKGGIDVDGSLFGSVIEDGLSQPFLFIWSENPQCDALCQQSERDFHQIYESLPHGGYQITIHGARHFNFADSAVFYLPTYHLAGVLGKIDGERGLALANEYIVAFFDQVLKGVPNPLLENSPYPEIEFESNP